MRRRLLFVPLVTAFVPAARAATYFTVEQVQATMFPGETMKPEFRTLDDGQVSAIRSAAGVSPLSRQLKAWRASGGGWLIVDDVVGKHEYITYAVALDRGGGVKMIEIMDYRESYGYEIRDAAWRAQFTGRKSGGSLELGREIRNVAGATLSCKHVTDGVRRLLATYAIVLSRA